MLGAHAGQPPRSITGKLGAAISSTARSRTKPMNPVRTMHGTARRAARVATLCSAPQWRRTPPGAGLVRTGRSSMAEHQEEALRAADDGHLNREGHHKGQVVGQGAVGQQVGALRWHVKGIACREGVRSSRRMSCGADLAAWPQPSRQTLPCRYVKSHHGSTNTSGVAAHRTCRHEWRGICHQCPTTTTSAAARIARCT